MDNLPNHILQFDLLQFINRRVHIMHAYQAIELELYELKLRNSDKDVSELKNRVNILREHYAWLGALQNEYETIQKVNTDYVNQNLVLLDKYKKLSQVNKELEKEIYTLKANFAQQ